MDVVTLGDIIKLSKGKKAESITTENADGTVRYIQIDDLRNDNNLKYTNSKGVIVSPDDVVIAWDGANAGTIGFGLSGVIGSTLAKMSLTNSQIDPSYLGLLLRSKFDYLRSKTTGATIPHINKSALMKINVPVVSLSEQKRIVSVIHEAELLLSKRKETLKLIDSYLDSKFAEMFGDLRMNAKGWDTYLLKDITLKITDGTHQSPKFVDSGIPFIFISNIVNNEITLNTKKFISEQTYHELTRSTPIQKYDILYTTVGSYGHPAIVKTDNKFCFQRHIAHIKPDISKTNVYFLYGMLKTPYVKQQADERAKGVAQKTLNLSELGKFQVILPPMEMQNKYANIVAEVEIIKKSMLEQLAELNEYYHSLLNSIFGQNQNN